MSADEGDDVQAGELDEAEQYLDKIFEKRASTREDGFRGFNKALAATFHKEFVEKRVETIMDGVIKGLKRGSDAERILAAQSIGLLAVTLGGGSDDFYAQMSAPLITVINDHPSHLVKAQAVSALSVSCFVCNTDPTKTQSCVAFLENLFEASAHLLAPEALKGWCLLLSTMTASHIARSVFPDKVKTVVSLLADGDKEARTQAGLALAFLFESVRDASEEEIDINSFAHLFDVDGMLDSLNELAKERNHGNQRKELFQQRSFFKEILNSVQNGDNPEEQLTVCNQKLSFDSWLNVKQLEAFREVLQEGLLNHFATNELLAEVFGFQIQKNQKKQVLTKEEKRAFMSPNSAVNKYRTRAINKMRNTRQAQITSFYDD